MTSSLHWVVWICGIGYMTQTNKGPWLWNLATLGGQYTNWFPGQPDYGLGQPPPYCALIWNERTGGSNKRWDDNPCNNRKYFVCEAGKYVNGLQFLLRKVFLCWQNLWAWKQFPGSLLSSYSSKGGVVHVFSHHSKSLSFLVLHFWSESFQVQSVTIGEFSHNRKAILACLTVEG